MSELFYSRLSGTRMSEMESIDLRSLQVPN